MRKTPRERAFFGATEVVDGPGENQAYRGRFAPSPTGDLHLGNLLAAVGAAARAHHENGEVILRMEDLDTQRNVPGAAEQIVEDLDTLGFAYSAGPHPHSDDGLGPYVQSECQPRYVGAMEKLKAAGRIYACSCSRKELRQIASAPHQGEEGPAYPGICRHKNLPFDDPDLPVSWRFLVEPGEVGFVDRLAGPYAQDVAKAVGDFVVRRKDGLMAYQLAVVVDDAHQKITEVVRGRDLLSSTPRQIQLHRALSQEIPAYAHVPLWLQSDGTRMAKRMGAETVRGLMAAGHAPERVLGRVGRALGVCTRDEAIGLDDLVERLTPEILSAPSVFDEGPALPSVSNAFRDAGS
jgi:glutamyl-tRNA synthetase